MYTGAPVSFSTSTALEKEVHVWVAVPRMDFAAVSGERSLESLSETEREQCVRFRRQADGETYTRAHMCLRNVLSRYDAVAPKDWVYEYGSFGKPALARRCNRLDLRFSLSYTRHCIAVAITRQWDVGIDVEAIRSVANFERQLTRYCSPQERAAILRLERQHRAKRFTQYWTLKEAYTKARGRGLNIPFDTLSFSIEGKVATATKLGRDLGDGNDAWRFALLQPAPDHVLAVASYLPVTLIVPMYQGVTVEP